MQHLNIGLIGHVSHGKSTIIKALSGITTLRHSKEKQKNSTILLGYANTIINNKNISFIDCPGHEAYIHNMLNGVQLMDIAFLIVDVTDKIVLQSQAIEHLTILLAMGIENIIVIQNKVDLLDIKNVRKNSRKIHEILEEKFNIKPMIYPISAQFNIGTDEIIELISKINGNKCENDCIAIMPIIRSFDVNKPRTSIDELKGGIIGGGLLTGQLEKNKKVLIIPGIIKNKTSYPLITNINKIQSENDEINSINSKNLIGLETNIDPYFTKNNGLVGQFVYYGNKENLTIYDEIVCKIKSLKRVKKSELKKIHNIKIHCINKIYNAIIKNYENNTLTLKIEKPFFFIKKWHLGIFIKINDTWKFSFIGQFINGNIINCDTSNYQFPLLNTIPIKKNQNEMPEYNEKEYKTLLEKYCENKKETKKLVMKMPIIKIVQNFTNWLNVDLIIQSICEQTKNEKDILENIFKKEIKMILGNFREVENMVQFDKKINLNNFTTFLKSFRKKYLECSTCYSYNTSIVKKYKICSDCNSNIFIS